MYLCILWNWEWIVFFKYSNALSFPCLLFARQLSPCLVKASQTYRMSNGRTKINKQMNLMTLFCLSFSGVVLSMALPFSPLWSHHWCLSWGRISSHLASLRRTLLIFQVYQRQDHQRRRTQEFSRQPSSYSSPLDLPGLLDYLLWSMQTLLYSGSSQSLSALKVSSSFSYRGLFITKRNVSDKAIRVLLGAAQEFLEISFAKLVPDLVKHLFQPSQGLKILIMWIAFLHGWNQDGKHQKLSAQQMEGSLEKQVTKHCRLILL